MTYRLPVALVFAACASVCGAQSSTSITSGSANAAGAANVPDAAKAAKALKAARAAKAARVAKATEAAKVAEAAELAKAAQAIKAVEEATAKAAEAAEVARVADALKTAEAAKAAEAAQAQAAGLAKAAQAAQDAEVVRAAIPRLQFVDMGGFDQTLSSSLNTASPKVEVGFYDKVTPSALPERLQKWMAAVESRGGKVKIIPPPSNVTAKNPFLLISAISSIWSVTGMVKDASAESRFAVAGNYDAELVLKQDDKGDTLVEKLVFVQRAK